MTLNTEYLQRCLETLEKSYSMNKAVLRRSASLNREPWRLRCLIRHSKGSLTFLIASLSRTLKNYIVIYDRQP